MKRTVYLSLAAMICACTAQTGLPDINAGWNFTADDGRAALVDLPHDAMMGASRSADVPCGGPEAFFQGESTFIPRRRKCLQPGLNAISS